MNTKFYSQDQRDDTYFEMIIALKPTFKGQYLIISPGSMSLRTGISDVCFEHDNKSLGSIKLDQVYS
jgi:hypothetical protein